MPISTRRWRTGAVAALSVGLHAAALAAFVLRSEPPPMAAGAGAAIAVTLVARPLGPEPADAVAPAVLAPPAAGPEVDAAAEASDVTSAALASTALAGTPEPSPQASAGAGSDLTGCAFGDDVRTALLGEAPRAALARIPERHRSVAGAVMLWDRGWVRTGALADPRIARPIQAAIAGAVRAAEPACAAAPVEGPVFLIVPDDAGRSLVLVLGSGAWRWADLAAAHPTAAGGR